MTEEEWREFVRKEELKDIDSIRSSEQGAGCLAALINLTILGSLFVSAVWVSLLILGQVR